MKLPQKYPVGALNLLAEAVAEAKDDPEAVVRFSSRMHTESERLTRLVQQIIALSRLQNHTPRHDAPPLTTAEPRAEPRRPAPPPVAGRRPRCGPGGWPRAGSGSLA